MIVYLIVVFILLKYFWMFDKMENLFSLNLCLKEFIFLEKSN